MIIGVSLSEPYTIAWSTGTLAPTDQIVVVEQRPFTGPISENRLSKSSCSCHVFVVHRHFCLSPVNRDA